MKKKKFRYFVGDFETTVYDGQTHTEVWASALVELYNEDVKVFHSINETFQAIINLNCHATIFYHNLKFDGTFWISYLLNELHFEQAYTVISKDDEPFNCAFKSDDEMKNKSFKYTISDRGQWYVITIKVNNKFIVLQDSLKLLPFSLKKIGKGFQTKHQKLDMDYKGLRFAGCNISLEEQEYIKNDVLVIKEALEIMFNENHTELTIGSCCLKEFKNGFSLEQYKVMYPNLYDDFLPEEYGADSVGEYIRKSYKGGWCYLVENKANQIIENGLTIDVNSLYPSMMHSISGNIYPVGKPTFWKGNYIPEFRSKMIYWFVRIKTRFYLKDGYLPFIQIKNNINYHGNESLKTSDLVVDGKSYTHWVDRWGVEHDTRVEMVMTMTDYILFREHYHVEDFEILDGCYFNAEIGLFDMYIDKYKKIKQDSKGAKRELAKLFLNNLYGKMATSPDAPFKVVFIKEDGSLGFKVAKGKTKKGGYIPIGSAITSYARNFTIRAAQMNYINGEGFIYADTDSLHCSLAPEKLKGVDIHDTEFCCWKLESKWDKAIFVRQKTYMEHITHDGEEEIEPYFNIKCAGMPEKSKQLFLRSLNGDIPNDNEELTEYEREFLSIKRDMTDFKIGLKVSGKLIPVQYPGGTVLIDSYYEMRD